MIGYFDTSAVVPLLIDEPTSGACSDFWIGVDSVACCHLGYVEAAAALAQAQRSGRIATPEHDLARRLLDGLWQQVDVIEIDFPLVRVAADLARNFGLRGYDAVHCASALQLADDSLVAGSGDRQLLDAWCELGVATFDTNG